MKKFNVCIFIVFSMVCFLITCYSSGVQTKNSISDVILQGNKMGLEAITSVKANVKITYDDRIENSIQKIEYDWYISQNKFREEEYRIDKENRVLSSIVAFNGDIGFSWHPESNFGAIYDDIKDKDVYSFVCSALYLPSGNGSSKSMYDLIVVTNPQFIGKETILGVEAYKFIGTEKDLQHIWWIAPKYNYQVIQHEWSMCLKTDPAKMYKWIYRVERFYDNKSAVFFPQEVTSETYVTNTIGEDRLLNKDQLSLSDI